ncbi:MAG: SDR family oxidoreductase [Myxococcota bacterium]
MARFNDKVVLVSGGGSGIGKAAAELFAAEGAKVFITGRREAPLKAVAESGSQLAWLSADVSKPGDAARIVEAAVAAFGRLDVLVNNAGTFTMGPLAESSDDEIARVFSVNVFGTLALTREALPQLIQHQGAVVNVSTTLTRGVMPGTSVYAASKAALDHVTRVIAAEVGPMGVRVNAVAPGLTVTDMSAGFRQNDDAREMAIAQTPMGRMGDPVDVARAIALAASPEASWVTGQVIQASGGFML